MAEINMKLVRKVLAHVKGDLKRLKMSVYGQQREGREGKKGYPACETRACFAGWTVLLTTPKKKWAKLFFKSFMDPEQTASRAQKLLGLTDGERYHIFSGRATNRWTTVSQFSQLKKDINGVLKGRGMKERV